MTTMQLSELPALHRLLTAEEWEIKPNGCSRCPFASPDPAHDFFDSHGGRIEGGINFADPDEGYYLCGLLGKSGIWGENPPCTLADWRARALAELEGCGVSRVPAWCHEALASLQKLWPVTPAPRLALVATHQIWEMHPTADGACHIASDGTITIYLRAKAEDTEYWRDTLIHEYTHAAMAEMLGLLPREPDDNTRRIVEIMTERVAGLLDYAVRTGAQRRQQEPTP